MRRPLLALLLLAALPSTAVAGDNYVPDPVPGKTRGVILVGNNWDGTTDIVDPETFERLDRVNVIPDKAERIAEKMARPDSAGFFIAVRELIGEGHDQYNDDIFSSHDGRRIFVSRPSFADVVAIDLATKKIVWRAPVDGYRSDHMMISQDGTRLLVSASTGNVVHELDTETGKRTGVYASGDSPHENIISKDGTKVFHASIGRVYMPFDREPVRDPARGAEHFQVMDTRTKQVVKRIDIREKLAEAGFGGMSGAVRPMAISPDETKVYFQVSFFFGFVEYDLVNDKVLRLARLPESLDGKSTAPENFVLDSAHHGLALDPKGEKLCVAGTSSNYSAIVSTRDFSFKTLDSGRKPYWSTNSADGRHCYVSSSQDDLVAVIDYESEQIVHKFAVGFHPQRVRNGVVRVAEYPQGKHGEAFALETFSSRQPLTVKGFDENVGCRAKDAKALRLVRCQVQLRSRGKKPVTLAAGEAFGKDQRAVVVDVDVNRTGRAALRRAGRKGLRVTLVARGVDSVGRVARTTRVVRIRRG